MLYFHTHHAGRSMSRFAMLTTLLLTSFAAVAHTPFLLVSLTDDGQVRVETGFSDGSTGAGMPIEFLDLETGAVLSRHSVPEDGILLVSLPAVPYEVMLDAGEGHRVTKDGPLPAAPAPESGGVMLVNAEAGDASRWTNAARDAIDAAQVIVAQEYLAARIGGDWQDKTLVLLESGVALGADAPAAKELRERTLARIRAALDAGQAVVVLTYGVPESCPDWAWLLDAELRAKAAGAAAP